MLCFNFLAKQKYLLMQFNDTKQKAVLRVAQGGGLSPIYDAKK